MMAERTPIGFTGMEAAVMQRSLEKTVDHYLKKGKLTAYQARELSVATKLNKRFRALLGLSVERVIFEVEE